MGVLAAVAGVDPVATISRAACRPPGWVHFLGNATAITSVFPSGNLAPDRWRTGHRGGAVGTILSAVVVVIFLVTVARRRTRVFRHRIGMIDGKS